MSEERDLFGNIIEQIEVENSPEVLSNEENLRLDRILDELLNISECCFFTINNEVLVGRFSMPESEPDVTWYGPDGSEFCVVIDMDGVEEHIITKKQLLNATEGPMAGIGFKFKIKAFRNNGANMYLFANNSANIDNSIEVLCYPMYGRPRLEVDCGILSYLGIDLNGG